jgi:hypothetical protein
MEIVDARPNDLFFVYVVYKNEVWCFPAETLH